jgi:hypothetical protein
MIAPIVYYVVYYVYNLEIPKVDTNTKLNEISHQGHQVCGSY